MTDFTFTDNANAAYQETVNRSVAGMSLSPRLWNLTNTNQANISRAVGIAVRTGTSVTAAGKDLLNLSQTARSTDVGGIINVKVPKYIQELYDAAAQARAVSDSNALQRVIRQYQGRINSLLGSNDPEYQHIGMGSSTKMFVKRLQSANDDVFNGALDKWIDRKAKYFARQVARNETNEANWLATQKEAGDMPFVTGMKWNLGRHPEVDICDTYATQNRDDLGPGVYPKGSVPKRPHPNCLIPGQNILMENGKWKPIENIRVGDEIIGCSGRSRKVLATHKNEFTGDVFELNISNGNSITVTGNHPIYTANEGWVDAQNIQEGHKVFDPEFMIIGPYFNNSPSIFGKILKFYSIMRSFLWACMPISSVDFNGQLPFWNGNINVEFINGEKRDMGNIKAIKDITKSNLIGCLFAFLLNAKGTADKALIKAIKDITKSNLIYRLFTSAHYFISNFSLFLPLQIVSCGPYQLSGIGLIAPSKIIFSESISDALTANAHRLSQEIDTFTGQVSPVSLNNIEVSYYAHDVIIPDVIVKSSKKHHYEGSVFNLTVDKDQSYFAEGILVHNCNCFLTTVVDMEYFDKNKPSPDMLNQVASDPQYSEYKSWATGWLEKYGTGWTPAKIAAIAPAIVTPTNIVINDSIAEAQRYGINTSNEISIFVNNETGETIKETLGPNGGSLTNSMSQFKADTTYTSIHNHPSSSSFSTEDVTLLLHREITEIKIIGNDGTKYSLRWDLNINKKIPEYTAENYDLIRRTRDDMLTKTMSIYMPRVQEIIDRLKAEGQYSETILNKLTNSIWKEHTHDVSTRLAKELGMIYTREMPR